VVVVVVVIVVGITGTAAAALVADALPSGLVAVTVHVSWWPASPDATVYVEPVAPSIDAPSRCHWYA
jgi:hypothetical protein